MRCWYFAMTSKNMIIDNQASQYPAMNSYEKKYKQKVSEPEFQDV